jgi:hypothetical protein
MSDPHDSAWPHEEPSADFADRVMARIEGENGAKRVPVAPVASRLRSRWVRPAAATFALAAAAAILFALRPTAPSQGEARAETRREIAVGTRAVAVAEPGAHLTWRGDDVTQDEGDIFYRVERGERFVVHTPAGDVAVLGTCFRVRVGTNGNATGNEESTDMNARDVKVGLVGAASALLATVVVYEGKVAVSHAGQPTSAASATQLTAGQSARLDASGVHVGAGAKDGGEGASATGDESLLAANANLSQAIGEYNRRLNAITAEKVTLQQKLTSAQEQLAAAGNDASAPLKDPFDLSTDDWKQLAAKGLVRVRMPCIAKDPWSPSAAELQKMGLAPSDGPAVHEAYVKANQRVWADVRPLCAAALGGDTQVADRLGVNVCMNVVQDTPGVEGTARRVAEMRAGLRPLPGAGDTVDGPTQMLLDMTHEQQLFEADLASSFGPEEAHRLLYGDSGACLNDWSEGNRDDVLKQ